MLVSSFLYFSPRSFRCYVLLVCTATDRYGFMSFDIGNPDFRANRPIQDVEFHPVDSSDVATTPGGFIAQEHRSDDYARAADPQVRTNNTFFSPYYSWKPYTGFQGGQDGEYAFIENMSHKLRAQLNARGFVSGNMYMRGRGYLQSENTAYMSVGVKWPDAAYRVFGPMRAIEVERGT